MAGRQHGSGEKAHAQAQRRGRRRRSFFLLLSGRQAGTLEKPWLVLLTPEQEISREGKSKGAQGCLVKMQFRKGKAAPFLSQQLAPPRSGAPLLIPSSPG